MGRKGPMAFRKHSTAGRHEDDMGFQLRHVIEDTNRRATVQTNESLILGIENAWRLKERNDPKVSTW